MLSNPKITIIILHWNNYTDTLSCLASVAELDYDNYQVVVIDNGSSNNSAAIIADAHPDIKILVAKKNLGYTGGNNMGIEFAIQDGCDFVWLLNDDVTVAPNSLSALVGVAITNPKVGFLGPKVYMHEDRQRFLSCGGIIDNYWHPRLLGIGELDKGQYDDTSEVDYLSGCALLVSQETIQAIGMLDDDFFAYHEDIEWCYRGKRANLKVVFVPEAKVWHPDTQKRDGNSPLVTYYISRNSLIFAKKNSLGIKVQMRLLMSYLRTLLSWTLRPKWRNKHRQRDALWQALLDFARGQFGHKEFG